MQMKRKQLIALVIMAGWLLINWQNGAVIYFDEERWLEDFVIGSLPSTPRLSSLNEQQLEDLSTHLETYTRSKALISIVNTVLLIYLSAVYLDLYRDTRSSFSLGLLFLSVALLFYTLFTNPAILILSPDEGGLQVIRLFNILPDFFTTIASAILIYLSRQ
jgi:hypothetical protein